MSCSGFLTRLDTTLVIDTSVAINLIATRRAQDIIAAQSGAVVVTKHAFCETASGSSKGHRNSEVIQDLISAGVLRVAQLGDRGCRIYASLVDGSAARTLDDGEAATIGCACELAGVAAIDERKARSLCSEAFPQLEVISTVDILLHECARQVLGEEGQIEAIVRALRDARMRVPPHQVKIVVNLIGESVAATCSSLPKSSRVAT